MDENSIRKELAKTIAEDSQNIDKILKLSHDLALSDKNNVRFSVDSSVIERLGRELVARHETAVSELVKNAYDADATLATLNFVNVDYEGGTLFKVLPIFQTTNRFFLVDFFIIICVVIAVNIG